MHTCRTPDHARNAYSAQPPPVNLGFNPGKALSNTALATNRQLLLHPALSAPDAKDPLPATTNSELRKYSTRNSGSGIPPETQHDHKRKPHRCTNTQFLAPPTAAAAAANFAVRWAGTGKRTTRAYGCSPPSPFLPTPLQHRSPSLVGGDRGKTAAI